MQCIPSSLPDASPAPCQNTFQKLTRVSSVFTKIFLCKMSSTSIYHFLLKWSTAVIAVCPFAGFGLFCRIVVYIFCKTFYRLYSLNFLFPGSWFLSPAGGYLQSTSSCRVSPHILKSILHLQLVAIGPGPIFQLVSNSIFTCSL